MQISISRRAFVRAVSYTAALVLVLGGLSTQHFTEAADYRRQLENSYARSLGELSSYLANLSTDLDKGQYIGTGVQLSQLSARIWKESGGAKSALSALPVSELHMDGTYKFLSQVGDYAMALSKKVAAGGVLTQDEKKNAQALQKYAAGLRDYVDEMQQKIRDGQIDVAALRTAHPSGEEAEGTRAQGVAAGFEEIEQTMTGYPTLIYDGPFSDHLLTRRPRMTQGLALVTPEQALQRAASAARLRPSDLTPAGEENSNMPSYLFTGEGISVGVTKAGGLVTYLINDREAGEQRLSKDTVFEHADRYLNLLGLDGMRATYYETNDGICTVNYAATNGEVTLYTDLVKVGVALDDGGIVFYDARGYINNHRERALEPPAITEEEALASVNPSLTILSSRVALIPTSGQNEVLTYEFLAQSEGGQKLLTYINAATGAEEQILLLIETPGGTLTK